MVSEIPSILYIICIALNMFRYEIFQWNKPKSNFAVKTSQQMFYYVEAKFKKTSTRAGYGGTGL